MCSDDIQARMLACLERIELLRENEQYEPGGFFTIGGAVPTVNTIMYALKSPFNTECEFSLVCAGAQTNRLAMAIAVNNQPVLPDLSGATPYGAISKSDGSLNNAPDVNNPLPNIVILLGANQNMTFPATWWPLPENATLYAIAQSNAGSTAAFVTLAFRRKLYRIIPEKPRQRPQTHTLAPSRAPLRRLSAQSTMVAGFQSQYPEPGGPPYQHTPLPQQDGMMQRHGVQPVGVPLKPTRGKIRGR